MRLAHQVKQVTTRLTQPQRIALEWALWVLLSVVVFFTCFYIARAIDRANFDEKPYQPANGQQLELEDESDL